MYIRSCGVGHVGGGITEGMVVQKLMLLSYIDIQIVSSSYRLTSVCLA